VAPRRVAPVTVPHLVPVAQPQVGQVVATVEGPARAVTQTAIDRKGLEQMMRSARRMLHISISMPASRAPARSSCPYRTLFVIDKCSDALPPGREMLRHFRRPQHRPGRRNSIDACKLCCHHHGVTVKRRLQ
jgi:hypothetical protein